MLSYIIVKNKDYNMFTAIGLYVFVNIVFMLLVHYTGLFLPPLSYLIYWLVFVIIIIKYFSDKK